MLVKLHHIVYYRSFFSLLSAETRCGLYYESFNARRELFKCGLWFWCHYNPSPLGHRSYRTPTLTWVHNPESKSRFTFPKREHASCQETFRICLSNKERSNHLPPAYPKQFWIKANIHFLITAYWRDASSIWTSQIAAGSHMSGLPKQSRFQK